MSDQQPAGPAPQQAGKRPRGFETAGDMVRTMVVILGLALVVFFLAARPQLDDRPPADVAAVVEQAQAGGLGVTVPELPQGWKASNTRFGPDAQEGLPTFHVGYLDPTGAYGGISVTPAATPAWVEGVTGQDAVDGGTREVEGLTWQVWTNAETGGTTLVAEAPGEGSGEGSGAGGDGTAQTVAVTSRGSDAALQTLVAAALTATGTAAGTSAG